MNIGYSNLSPKQQQHAIQRLTALWAFTESGLGGIMHAMQIPFTGLLVGGIAIMLISLMAAMSEHKFKTVLKSALIVLIVKAMVSPHTPFPAYIAVSFQAVLGYVLFGLLNVNFISILLLSTISMLESAIQKILILTLFFGQSLWKAMDSMIAFLAGQFGNIVTNGSYWIIGFYLLIYFAGGVFIAWLSYRTLKNFNSEDTIHALHTNTVISVDLSEEKRPGSLKNYKNLWVLLICMAGLSGVLFVFAADSKQGWLEVAKTISWTSSAILFWYMLIGPLFTKAIQKLLQKKQSRYSDEVLKTLSFLPVLRQLSTRAWLLSKAYRGFGRWRFFFTALIHATLTYSEP